MSGSQRDIERAAEDAAGCSHHHHGHGDRDLFSPTNEGDAELVHRLKEDEADRATSIALLRAARRRSLDAEQLLSEIPNLTAGAAAADHPYLERVEEDGPADAPTTASRTSDAAAGEDAAAAGPAHGSASKPPLATTNISPGRSIFPGSSPTSASKAAAAAGSASNGTTVMGGAGGPASAASLGGPTNAAFGAFMPSGPRSVVLVPSTTVSVSGMLTVEEADVRSPQAFQRVAITGPAVLNAEQKQAARLLLKALAMREKHLYKKASQPSRSCHAYTAHSLDRRSTIPFMLTTDFSAYLFPATLLRLSAAHILLGPVPASRFPLLAHFSQCFRSRSWRWCHCGCGSSGGSSWQFW